MLRELGALRVSLRLGLVLAMAAILAGTLAIAAALTYRHAVQKLNVEMAATLSAVERTIKVALQDIGADPDGVRQVERLIHTFDESRHVRVALEDATGTVQFASSPATSVPDMPSWFLDLIAPQESRARIGWPAADGSQGHVTVTADPRNEAGEVWNDIRLHLTTLALFCALAMSLLSLLLGYALAPLGRLLAAFEKVGSGRFGEKIPTSGVAEIARLSEGFNRMTELLAHIDEKNARLNKQIEALQEEERAHLARELHDHVGPLLFSIDVDATTIRNSCESDGRAELAARAGAIQACVGDVKDRIRSILWQLRPSILLDLGLSNALESLAQSSRARHPGVIVVVDAPEYTWGEKTDQTIFAIAREAVHNALRHGKPTRIDIAVGSRDGRVVEAIISNDGEQLALTSAPGSLGLTGMRERAELAGGTIEVANRPEGRGVMVRLRLPIAERAGASSQAT